MSGVRILPPMLVEKVWGRTSLPEPFTAPDGKRIGEIWFEPPPELPQLLVKYIFTSEKLSVQVHPSDATARGEEQGKEECWLILDAQPGARLAIGFDKEPTRQEIARAALDGSIEELLTWHEVAPGDIYFLPPGTVHAIGPGLSLVEVQQNSDTTFRLYDYGRPRELHLERGLTVLNNEPYAAKHKSSTAQGGECLIASQHFRLNRIEGEPDAAIYSDFCGPLLALPLSGHLQSIDGVFAARAGDCLFAPSLDALDFSKAEVTLLTQPQ